MCLLATKGHPKRQANNIHQLIVSPVEAHSKKPEKAREKITALMGNLPKIELFARKESLGWDRWRNEEKSSITKVKTKVAFNLTKRQIICFTAALILGLPVFFLLKGSAGTSLAAFFMILVMLPFFLFAMYEKHRQPPEIILKHIVQTKFIRKKECPYRTRNYYALLIKQRKLEKEVFHIVKGQNKGKKQRKK